MPKRREATPEDVEAFDEAGQLSPQHKAGTIIYRQAQGEYLEFEESVFDDPGLDYTALFFSGERVGYWKGF